jgi:hypothetical protein
MFCQRWVELVTHLEVMLHHSALLVLQKEAELMIHLQKEAELMIHLQKGLEHHQEGVELRVLQEGGALSL